MITVVDYGMGNIGSILNMLKRIGADAAATGRPEEVGAASKLILPGVGAFGQAMANLQASGLDAVLRQRVERDGVPVLGICLGMQLLTESSEEGPADGFGWIPGRTVRFRLTSEDGLKVPHMGWNSVMVTRRNPLIGEGEQRFYFVHSYHAECADEYVIGRAHYGYPFPCALQHRNVLGVQFHPEKSHRFGLDLLTRFVEWQGGAQPAVPAAAAPGA